MRILMIMMGIVVFLSGCSTSVDPNPIKGNSTIDWVDFVKLNGDSYTGLYGRVLKNPGDVTDEVVGEVKFKVGDVVTNPNYKTKAGDAAFLEIGTKLYRVNGYKSEELIAAKDENQIGGYRLYAGDDFVKTLQLHYKDMPKDKVERIELYHFDQTTPFNTLLNDDKERFIELLDHGKDTPNYRPQNKDGDPAYYQMVFYTDGPLGYAYSIADDRVNVFFYPWDTRVVDDEVRNWLNP
ncbi:hypothetical protein FHR92_001328 [Fontibacillus solani]|uniref:DUF4163 domain-containing protein n=1 Tax=Fontibacillus solani TaxID=1572857 RepID=A0A7W3SRE3_9BACL|nr:hypothetical protein [Fontibacillus solani]MBA9084867.1 hypothetical protein [Fontibacillus solani]